MPSGLLRNPKWHLPQGPGVAKAALSVISVSGDQGHSGDEQEGRTGMVWALSHLPRKSAHWLQMVPTPKRAWPQDTTTTSPSSKLQTGSSLATHVQFCSLGPEPSLFCLVPAECFEASSCRPPAPWFCTCLRFLCGSCYVLPGGGGGGGRLCTMSCRQGAGSPPPTPPTSRALRGTSHLQPTWGS